MKVTWAVDDGYIGKDRPQHSEIPDDEWIECQTDEQKQDLIDSYIQEDFEMKISWYVISKEEE